MDIATTKIVTENMSSQKENDSRIKQFPVELKLYSLDSVDLYNLVQYLLERKPELYTIILEWFKEKQKNLQEPEAKKEAVSINDELLMDYWEDAREIISEFNEYGGGPEEDEDEAYSHLNRISNLIKEGNISTRAKLEFLDDAFEEYNHENSGFESTMITDFRTPLNRHNSM